MEATGGQDRGAVVAVGLTMTMVLVQPGVGAMPRAVAAVLVTGCVLAVAAPRPWSSGPRTNEGPCRFETTDGTACAYHLLGVDREATPAVYLHGGPGVSTRQQDLPWLEALAPGSLDPEADLADDPSVRLEGRDRIRLLTTLLRPRELYTYALSRVDPIAAHHLLGDAEMDRRYEDVLQAVWPAMLCIPDRASGLPPPSGGFFANQLTHQRRTPSGPVSVVADPPPTLVLKPECDYLPWSVVDGFVERLDVQVAYVRGAGHAVHVERGEHVADSIADFLTGGTPPGVLIDPTSAPPSYQGPP